MVAGARQNFQFFRQNTWFLENNRALSKFKSDLNQILHYLINCKNSFRKIQFYVNTTQSTFISNTIDSPMMHFQVFCVFTYFALRTLSMV